MGFDSRQRQEMFSLHIIQTGSGAHLASYPIGTGTTSPELKRQEREAENSPCEEQRNYTSVVPWRGAYLIEPRDNFTFHLYICRINIWNVPAWHNFYNNNIAFSGSLSINTFILIQYFDFKRDTSWKIFYWKSVKRAIRRKLCPVNYLHHQQFCYVYKLVFYASGSLSSLRGFGSPPQVTECYRVARNYVRRCRSRTSEWSEWFLFQCTVSIVWVLIILSRVIQWLKMEFGLVIGFLTTCRL
jgi:hypothetical protein